MELKTREYDLLATAGEFVGWSKPKSLKWINGSPVNFGESCAHEPTDVEVFGVKRNAADLTTIVG